MRIVRTEYAEVGDRAEIYEFIRNADKTRTVSVVKDFRPYFYILDNENIDSDRIVRVEKVEHLTISREKIKKVVIKLPKDVPELREKISKSYEADLVYPTRYLIDKVDVLEPTEPKVLFLDIEVDVQGRMPKVQEAREPIICIGTWCSDVYSTFTWRPDLSPGHDSRTYDNTLHEMHYFRTEQDMLKAFIDYVDAEGPDVISGWNLIRFDLMYLLNRMQGLGIDYRKLSPMHSAYTRGDKDVVIKGIALIDLYDAYRRFTFQMEESYKLDYIARKVVGEGKLNVENNLRWLWKLKLEDLIQYNLKDVALVKKINDKLRLLDFMDELRRLAFCQLEDTLVMTKLADCYILKAFNGKKVFPTRTHHPREEFEGAFVGSWATGVYDNVAVFDLKSLYPAIISCCNLSSDSIVEGNPPGDYIRVNNLCMSKTKKGYLPQVITTLFQERAKYKTLMKQSTVGSTEWNFYDVRQYAIKVLTNALYGQTAFVNSRIYDPRVAETTTYVGRQIIQWSKKFLEDLGFSVLYCDTDAAFWSTGDGDLELIESILNMLNQSYDDFAKQFNIDHHLFNMEFEKVYSKAFFGKSRKRYAGVLSHKAGQKTDLMEVVGFEVRRSDASQFSRALQAKVFDLILRQNTPKDEVLRHVGSEIDRIRNGNYTFEEIGIPKGITRELDSYEKPSANIRGAKYARDVLGIDISDKPKMLYVSSVPGYSETDVLCFDEEKQVPPGTQIDAEKMLTKIVRDKLESIFEALGWKISELQYHWKGKSPKKGTQLQLFEDL